ncbi:hypothetical protein KCU87_g134, partial [Aureobasidium melanogenum]
LRWPFKGLGCIQEIRATRRLKYLSIPKYQDKATKCLPALHGTRRLSPCPSSMMVVVSQGSSVNIEFVGGIDAILSSLICRWPSGDLLRFGWYCTFAQRPCYFMHVKEEIGTATKTLADCKSLDFGSGDRRIAGTQLLLL